MQRVVVGVDGTGVARGALLWAADAVDPLGVVHAVAAVTPRTALRSTRHAATSPAYLGDLERELETTWLDPIRGHVEVTARAHSGDAWDALVEEARDRDAEAIVVGAHVHTPTRPRTVGRTIRRLIGDLRCPLVVVPRGNRHRLSDGGPIIVGVGHGASTEAAVRWAAGLAQAHALPLGLVRATGEGPVFQVETLPELIACYVDPTKRVEWATEDVAELALLAQEVTHDRIAVAGSIVPGLPATELADLSRTATLLVIGRHRSLFDVRRHVAQPLHHELTHASCPVAVVPPATDDDDETD